MKRTSCTQHTIGVIGLGAMGFNMLKTLAASDRWRVVAVCDLNDERLAEARQLLPEVQTTRDGDALVARDDIDVVGIFTLADIRPRFLRAAIRRGKHVVAEKPIAATVAEEKELLRDIEASGRLVAVNLFNRNAWYHEAIQAFISEGQIGQTAILALSHQTHGLMPTEGHGPEGPPFHDCGMHYVDVARWYANSEYDQWHAQGLRMWSWNEPWWVTVHGAFRNGIVFNITQGFVYGQMAQTRVNRCAMDVIGTQGVVRMQHDFVTTRIEFHGISRTEVKQGPYGGKKLDVLYERFADALETGDTRRLPTARDSVIASEVSQAMHDAAARANAPCVGTLQEMETILAHRRERDAKR